MAKKNSSGRARISLGDPDFAGKRAVSSQERGTDKNKASKADKSRTNDRSRTDEDTTNNRPKPDHSKRAALNIKPKNDDVPSNIQKKKEANTAKDANSSKKKAVKVHDSPQNDSKDKAPNKSNAEKKKTEVRTSKEASKVISVKISRSDSDQNPKNPENPDIKKISKSKESPKVKEVSKTKEVPDTNVAPKVKENPDTKQSAKAKKSSDTKKIVINKPSESAHIETERVSGTATKSKAHKRKSTWRQHPMPAALRIALSIMLLLVSAVGIAWFILWREKYYDLDEVNLFISTKPQLFAYSCAIVFCLMAPVAALTWHVFFTMGLAFSVASVFSFIQMQKMQIRGQPFYPEELSLAGQVGELTSFVDANSVNRLVWGVIFVMLSAILLEVYACKVLGKRHKGVPWWQKLVIIPRITYTLLALVLLTVCSLPIKDKSIDWLDGELATIGWDQLETYARNGFTVAFYYNLVGTSLPKPEDYNKNRMAKLAENYRALKNNDDKRVPPNEVATNIVVILNESFYDPALLSKYKIYGGDVTPVVHEVFKKYPSGYMYSPEYGGGTANVEYEVQTGLSNFFAQTMPYQTVVPKLDKLLGVANSAKDYGFDTTAIHSYNGVFYRRRVTYPILGYNQFLDEFDMKYSDHDFSSSYINDWSIYHEALDILKSNNDSPKLLNLVTMQNHAPYYTAQYPNLQFSIKGATDDVPEGRDFYNLINDLQTLHESDRYLGEFLDEISQLDERTVVLWFGDHAASVLDEYINSDDPNDVNMAHLTPYFIYANFDIESEYSEAEVAAINKALGFDFSRVKGVDLPTTTPNCLLNQMYNILGVEKAPLYYLVDAVCEEIPILASSYLLDNKITETPSFIDYQLVNYDVTNGKHYWYGD